MCWPSDALGMMTIEVDPWGLVLRAGTFTLLVEPRRYSLVWRRYRSSFGGRCRGAECLSRPVRNIERMPDIDYKLTKQDVEFLAALRNQLDYFVTHESNGRVFKGPSGRPRVAAEPSDRPCLV